MGKRDGGRLQRRRGREIERGGEYRGGEGEKEMSVRRETGWRDREKVTSVRREREWGDTETERDEC